MLMSVTLLATMVVGGTLASEILSPTDFNNSEKQAVLIEQNVTASELIPPYSDYTVSVTNKSSDKVYVRTLLAFEALKDGTEPYLSLDETIQPIMEYVEGSTEQRQVQVVMNEKQYDVYECYYSLEKGETKACLQGFDFTTTVTNNDFADEQYCIMALSQALMAEEGQADQIAVPENRKQLFGAVTSKNNPWISTIETTEETKSTEINIEVQ